MTRKGLLVRFEARPGRGDEVEDFLRAAVPLVRDEPRTAAWFAVRFGRSAYGIVDFFPDDEARSAHLDGDVAKALFDRGRELFSAAPVVTKLDVLAEKTPATAAHAITRGLLLTLTPKEGARADMERFLRDGLPVVERHPGTVAWFAVAMDDGNYGIFDVFPDYRARLEHLAGPIPRKLAMRAYALLGGVPDLDLLRVVASHVRPRGGARPRPGVHPNDLGMR